MLPQIQDSSNFEGDSMFSNQIQVAEFSEIPKKS
jgi:hypothetical protein